MVEHIELGNYGDNRISEIAHEVRKRVLRTAWQANGGHIAPALSCTDIITMLYYGGFMNVHPDDPEWYDRDYFIMSKGHGALALYSVLGLSGFYDINKMDEFCKPGSNMGSLAKIGVPGVEATTGSLGHGLSYAVGIALACKIDNAPNRIYSLVGDGECEEGSIWEAIMSAAHYGLDNLTIIVDRNHLQAMDNTDKIISLGSIADKAKAFGLEVIETDGHNYVKLREALETDHNGKPLMIVANTVKGKGISFMENVPIWHYRLPDDEEIKIALKDLDMTMEELGEHEKCLFRNII